jgi:hypothetical protein
MHLGGLRRSFAREPPQMCARRSIARMAPASSARSRSTAVTPHAEREARPGTEQSTLRGILRIHERRGDRGRARGVLGRRPLRRTRQHRNALDGRDYGASLSAVKCGHHRRRARARAGRHDRREHRCELSSRQQSEIWRNGRPARERRERDTHRRDGTQLVLAAPSPSP